MNTKYLSKNIIILLICSFALLAFAGAQPNFLLIVADDCTYNDLPVYGGQNAKTPNIDNLAAQGLTFNNAGIATAMCQPARSELYSGLYPMRNGCAWNHAASYPDIKTMPDYLGDLGYRVGISGKVHVKPVNAFPFENVPGFDPSCVRNPTMPHDLNGIAEFISRSDEPFALVIALTEPHRPWVMGDASAYPVDQIILPENIVDVPASRTEFAKYLAEITYMDGQVGEILELLQKSDKADETLVIFTSEQGAQWPGCKWTTWDVGVHTGMIARLPGKIPPGKRTDALVQWADVLPTYLDMAGVDPETYPMDGYSFKDVLLNGTGAKREYLYAMHNNIPEGHAYPTRAVADGRFRFIKNLNDETIYTNRWIMGRSLKGDLNEYWPDWIWESSTDNKAYHLINRYMKRPAQELYDLESDPFEMKNLADDPEYAKVKLRLEKALSGWMHSQSDPGSELDTQKAFNSAKNLKHSYTYSNK
jgi:uncharacterized sulfatase